MKYKSGILGELQRRELNGTATLDELSAIDEIERLMEEVKELENKREQLETECSTLAAGVCEHRSGDGHGNPFCLKFKKSLYI